MSALLLGFMTEMVDVTFLDSIVAALVSDLVFFFFNTDGRTEI